MARGKRVTSSVGHLVLTPIVFVLIGLAVLYFWNINTFGRTTDNIDFIRSHINSRGELVDWQNEIGVKSVDDVKLFVEDGKVTIEYGKIALNWKRVEDLLDKDNLDNLELILITHQNTKNGGVKLYWCGEEIQKWVR